MFSLRIAISTAFLLALSACAHSGNPKVQDQAAAVQQVKKGVTTQDEIKAMYGEPQVKTALFDGGSKWEYSYVDAKVRGETFIPFVGLFAGGADADVSSLELEFDKFGKVTRMTTGKGKVQTQNFGETKQQMEKQEH